MFSTRAGGTGPAGGSAADIDPRLLEYLHCESIAPSGLQLAASLPGECPPAAPIGLAGATMEPCDRCAGFWQRCA